MIPLVNFDFVIPPPSFCLDIICESSLGVSPVIGGGGSGSSVVLLLRDRIVVVAPVVGRVVLHPVGVSPGLGPGALGAPRIVVLGGGVLLVLNDAPIVLFGGVNWGGGRPEIVLP